MKLLTNIEFIEKITMVHGYKYDYSKVNYKGNRINIIIICPIHGEFNQSPRRHLVGSGCKKCYHDRATYNRQTRTNIIDRAKKIHGDKYDYSLAEYQGYKTKMKIICPIHGIFEQILNSHLNGSGCYICNESKGEKEIVKYLETNNIDFIRQKRFDDCRNKNTLPFDFYLPNYNVCIEFQGIQHFESVKYFGGEKKFEETKKRDKIKREYCEKNNIKLIVIKYDYKIINLIL